MAGKITANVVQLGDSATASQNFHLKTNVDGSLSLNRGNDGASLGSVLSISAGSETVQRIMTFTAQSATGTSIDFTGIPSWAKEISVMFDGVSGNGTSNFLLQLGTSTGIDNSGYLGSVNRETNILGFSTGFQLMFNSTAATSNAVNVNLSLLNTNNWVCSFISARSDNAVSYGAGSKGLSNTLDRIRITTVNGTDLFDAGSINILVKG